MRYRLVDIDSSVLGAPVLALEDVTSPCDIAALEDAYVRELSPAYVSCRVQLGDVAALHALQAHDFRFIECQLKTVVEPRRMFDTSAYPYSYEQTTTAEDLESVVAIACTAIRHDRFSIDPEIPPWYSGRRYEAYVRQSCESADDEVWHLREHQTGRIVAFRTHRRLAGGDMLLLLDAVSPRVPTVGVSMIAAQFFLSEMCRRGVPALTTHASVINLPSFTLEITGLGFRLVQPFAVLRKIYRKLT